MTTIKTLRDIVAHTLYLPNKAAKSAYLGTLPQETLNFLAKNIKMDGVGKIIGSEIRVGLESTSTMEVVVDRFAAAAAESSKKYKIRIMQMIVLSAEDRDFVLTCLYGSLKLGITIKLPDPVFGEIIRPELCGTGIDFDPATSIIEEKYDGVRCVAMNVEGRARLYTRKGKVLVAEKISDEIVDAIPPGYVLDGELVASDGVFQNMKRHSEDIVFKVFDMVFCNNLPTTNVPLISRRELMSDYVEEQDHIEISPILNLNNIKDINRWIENNHAEGIIAKPPESTYTYDSRKEWVKLKPFMDTTCNVVGFTEGTGKRAGDDLLGAIEVIPIGSTVMTKVGTGFSDADLAQMRQLLKEHKNITVDIKFQDITAAGCMRFPAFLRIREIL